MASPHQHIGLVDMVAGITPPPKPWVELRERFDTFLALNDAPLRQQVVDAVLHGGDIVTLRALAFAEVVPGFRDGVVGAVQAAVQPAPVALYSKAAVANYGKVAKEFDGAASKFTTAALQCDPEAEPASIVGQPDSVRTSWLNTLEHAAELDALVPVLLAAAELADIPLPRRTGRDSALLALMVDPGGLHRRRVWEAWRVEGGRCGHWAALVALGATIRAWPAERITEFTPYREPMPLKRKQFPVPGQPFGTYQPVLIDPEDPDYIPEAEEPKRRALAR
jgi:hypothetical protein